MKALYIIDVTVSVVTESKVDLSSMTAKQKDNFAKKRNLMDGRPKIERFTRRVFKVPATLQNTESGLSFLSKEDEIGFIKKYFTKNDFGGNDIESTSYSLRIDKYKFSSNLMYGQDMQNGRMPEEGSGE